jgi:hypothetical protein
METNFKPSPVVDPVQCSGNGFCPSNRVTQVNPNFFYKSKRRCFDKKIKNNQCVTTEFFG